ncbi:MAG: DNA repair protein RecO [Planctomycetaceae bacterium]|nr:DNA repair protein RecO [Planctomycetaceae bacterium]
MSSEKGEAVVLRQVDFSESSRVVTFFSREYGKFAALAKGAKRLKGPFDAALDLLSRCRVVFIRKSSGALSLLTEARLITRFRPSTPDLSRVYGGYYVAELIAGMTEDFDPAPSLYDLLVDTLEKLAGKDNNPSLILVHFEIALLREIGLLPNLFDCSVCGEVVPVDQNVRSGYAHWVSQGGLLCGNCRREEYAGTSVSAGSIAFLRTISEADVDPQDMPPPTSAQLAECHRFAVSAITQNLGRKPSTLRYIKI